MIAKVLVALVAAACSAAANAQIASYDVTINGFTYTPNVSNISVGSRVTFQASSFHPLHFDADPAVVCTSDCRFLFTQELTGYSFYCGNHGGPNNTGMSGSIIVSADIDYVYANDFEQMLTPSFFPALKAD